MTRYAIVGVGQRSRMFFDAITDRFADRCELVALCDTNQSRMDYWNRRLADAGATAVPTYKANRFDEMVAEARPDVIIVCTVDSEHDRYIVRAMELGCDVISEKPMTTDAAKCRRVLDAIGRTGRRCTVTFNARYGPGDTKVKELLAAGTIGRVLSVHYTHLLDVDHGADYFRRWHRDRTASGGLMVHKCTHCFDLVNWWVDDAPESVHAFGEVGFYGPSPEAIDGAGERCSTCGVADICGFYLDAAASEKLSTLYLAAEHEDGYWRDRCVFAPGVTSEDNVVVSVRYRGGALLTYTLLAFSPYEGSRISFNGDRGLIEFTEGHTAWSDEAGKLVAGKVKGIEVFPHFGEPYSVEVPRAEGGHGGADTAIVRDLFGEPADDPLGRRADHLDGARSLLVGAAANRSMETGQPVNLNDLLRIP